MKIPTQSWHSILPLRAPLGRTLTVAAAAVMLLASACSQAPEAAEPEAAEPETEPAVVEPDPEPETEPAVVEPETEPAVVEPETEPAVVEPETEPAVVEPETEPAVVEPETEPAVVEPETESAVVEPETEPAVVEPETEPAVVEPETESAVVEPETESAVVEPETEPAVVEPETEPAVVEPDPEPETEPAVVEPETEPAVVEPETEPAVVEPEPVVDPEPLVDPEPVVDPDPVVVEPEPVVGPDLVWVVPYAGFVPVVHPDTPSLSWVLGHDAPTPEGLPALRSGAGGGDMPRPTPGLVEWSRWCVATATIGQCALALHQSVWGLDYLGASESCVIDQMTRQINGFVDWGTPVFQSGSGWFRCPSVVLPDPAGAGDFPLVVQSLADRCREVLPPDVDLVASRFQLVGGGDPTQMTLEEIAAAIGGDPAQMTADELSVHFERVLVPGAGCDEWAQHEMLLGGVPEYLPLQHMVRHLVVEWMQHHYGAPPRGEWGVL